MAATKTALDKEQALSIIYSFYKKLESYVNQSVTASAADLEKFLASNFQLTSNGDSKTKSSSDYFKRMQNFQKKYSHWEFSKPLEEPVLNGNRIAIIYRIDCTTHSGEKKQIFISAIGTIAENKIARWTQVTHEAGTGTWDK
jgi:hypothetical protein